MPTDHAFSLRAFNSSAVSGVLKAFFPVLSRVGPPDMNTLTSRESTTVRFLLTSALICLTTSIAISQTPELVVQTGQSGPVKTVVFSPDGKLLASCGEKTIHL